MRRRLVPVLLFALVLAPSAVAAKKHWAAKEINAVVQRGVLAQDAASFRPDDPLTQSELADALTLLALPAAANADGTVTMAQLDAQLVRSLGLKDTAYRFAQALRAAGLKPTSRFGTETVARLLGLRTNHPASEDALELGPTQPATRAEAAFSLARALSLEEWSLESLEEEAKTLALPVYEGRVREVLQLATSLVGHPYVWGGMSEKPQVLWGNKALPGGFDCSGFVWRVYKAFPDLAGTLRGRTSMAMSGEVPKAARIGRDALEPGDVLFFGARGPKSKPAQVDHMGIYLGNEWMVHSSGYGVALVKLEGWYAERFAWARRPLSEVDV